MLNAGVGLFLGLVSYGFAVILWPLGHAAPVRFELPQYLLGMVLLVLGLAGAHAAIAFGRQQCYMAPSMFFIIVSVLLTLVPPVIGVVASLLLSPLVVGVVAAHGLVMRLHRRPGRKCQVCGYALLSFQTTCPECGAGFAPMHDFGYGPLVVLAQDMLSIKVYRFVICGCGFGAVALFVFALQWPTFDPTHMDTITTGMEARAVAERLGPPHAARNDWWTYYERNPFLWGPEWNIQFQSGRVVGFYRDD